MEQNFRELDRSIRERIASWTGEKGAFLDSFPHTRSFLMDRDTLMRNKVHWGYEDKPSTVDLPRLTPDESVLYDDLRYNRIQEGLRLEQERIEYRDLVGFLTPGI